MAAWREHEDETLRQMWADGHSAATVARYIPGRSRNAIIGRIHRLGLEPRKTLVRTKPSKSHRWRRTWKPKEQRRKEVRREVPPPPPEGTIKFMDRTRFQCSYIYGEPTADAMCCGMAVKQGSSFCPAHHKACWTKEKPKKKKRSGRIGIGGMSYA